jgi:hypothetical protein
MLYLSKYAPCVGFSSIFQLSLIATKVNLKADRTALSLDLIVLSR